MQKDPRVYIYMPRFHGESAYMAALMLQQMINALWRAYGDQMADFEARVFPDVPSPFGFTGYDPDGKDPY